MSFPFLRPLLFCKPIEKLIFELEHLLDTRPDILRNLLDIYIIYDRSFGFINIDFYGLHLPISLLGSDNLLTWSVELPNNVHTIDNVLPLPQRTELQTNRWLK